MDFLSWPKKTRTRLISQPEMIMADDPGTMCGFPTRAQASWPEEEKKSAHQHLPRSASPETTTARLREPLRIGVQGFEPPCKHRPPSAMSEFWYQFWYHSGIATYWLQLKRQRDRACQREWPSPIAKILDTGALVRTWSPEHAPPHPHAPGGSISLETKEQK